MCSDEILNVFSFCFCCSLLYPAAGQNLRKSHTLHPLQRKGLSLSLFTLSRSHLSVIYEFDRMPDEQAKKPKNDNKTQSQSEKD